MKENRFENGNNAVSLPIPATQPTIPVSYLSINKTCR